MKKEHYLISAINNLLIYTTPQNVVDYIKAEQMKVIIGNPRFELKKIKKFDVYVDFLDCKKNYIKTRKNFETYGKAWLWIIKTFDRPNKDFIKYY